MIDPGVRLISTRNNPSFRPKHEAAMLLNSRAIDFHLIWGKGVYKRCERPEFSVVASPCSGSCSGALAAVVEWIDVLACAGPRFLTEGFCKAGSGFGAGV